MRPWMLVPIIFCSLIAHAAWSGEDIFIVTSAEPDVVERFAAEELQSYLQRISGTTFPIRSTRSHDGLNFIISGAENDEQLGSDGFILHTSGNNLYFLAKGPRGKLYAVYEFLEKYLGVRWYVSDANDEVVPKRTTGEIIQIVNRGVNERQIPSFIFREVTINLGGPNSLSALGKLRFNAVMTSYTQTDTWRSTTLPELQKRAIDLVIGGHSTYQRFLSPEKYFVEHPEWSIMHEGQRIGKDTLNDTATFCTTNKEALAIFLENLVDYVKKTPEAKFLYPWPSDSARWCACGTCSARSVGDRLLAL
ncbi:MAG TPA: DUF4838 domain-containing protein, partial [Sedimentisphaerales bacterium]|nr:DUF4838 domain-containing protein [Sedimentisphaerales bacterium]